MKAYILALALLCGCVSDTSPEVAADAQELLGCPFTRSNTLEYGARLYGWPEDAHGSDCVNVANATELGRGASYICSKQPDYARVFIPLQVAGCTMHAYSQGCGADGVSGCHGAWTHYHCEGYAQGVCWNLE
jgi:hypothetical protein